MTISQNGDSPDFTDGLERPYKAEDVERLRRLHPDRAHPGPPRSTWQLLHGSEGTKSTLQALGALTGNQAIQQVQAGLLAICCQRLAGGGGTPTAQARYAYADQSLYPSDSVPQLVRRINDALQRANQIQTPRPQSTPLAGSPPIVADAKAGFGSKLQCLRADEGHDQGRRRRACKLRGPALLGQEVRPHGRQGAGADLPSSSRSWPPPAWPPTSAGVPTLLVARADANSAKLITSDVDPRDRSLFYRHRTDLRGLLPLPPGRSRAAIARGAGFRALGRPDLVRDPRSPTSTRRGSSPRRSTPSSRASCWPTTARLRSTGAVAHAAQIAPFQHELGAWATASSS